MFRKCSEISSETKSLGLIFPWNRVLIFENSSRFSREPLGLGLSDLWEPMGLCRVIRTPRALDFGRPALNFRLFWYPHIAYTPSPYPPVTTCRVSGVRRWLTSHLMINPSPRDTPEVHLYPPTSVPGPGFYIPPHLGQGHP